MKKISLFLFSLLIMFSLCINVDAIGTAGDVISPGNGSYYEEGYTNYWPSFPGGGTNMFLRGIRVSIVTSTGTNIVSNDYVWDYQKNLDRWDDWANLQYVENKYSKASYLNGTTMKFTHLSNKNDIRNYISGNKLFKSLDQLEEYFGRNKFSKPGVINYLRKTVNGNSKMDISFTKEWVSIDNYNGNDYDTDLINLLKDLGVSSTYLTDVEKLKDLFMVVEPVSAVVLRDSMSENGNLYYGTFFELVNMINKTNFSDKRFSDLIDFVRKELPCSGVLTGRLTDIIKNKVGNLPGFTKKGYYFNNIQITYTTSCNNRLKKEDVLASNDYGMGVVWLYEFITPKNQLKNPSCYEVDQILGVESSKILSTNTQKFRELVNEFNTYVKNHPDEKLSEISVEWYQSCGYNDSSTPSEYICTPQYSVGTCSTKYENSVYYKDSSNGIIDDDYWKNCVFSDNGKYIGMGDNHKTSSAGELSYLDNSLGSSIYCPVYCIEEISANFDYTDTIGAIKAGGNFVWPQNTSVTSSRTCRAKITDESWEKFTSDVKNANNEIIEAYEMWQLEELKKTSINNPRVIEGSKNCSSCEVDLVQDTENQWFNECNIWEDSGTNTCDGYVDDNGTFRKGQCTGEGVIKECKTNGKRTICQCYKEVPVGEPYCPSGKMKNKREYIANPVSYGKQSWPGDSWCEGKGGPSYDVKTAKENYVKLLTEPMAYVNEMNKCYGLTNQNIITSSPQLVLHYNQGGYIYDGLLESYDTSVPPIVNAKCTDENNIDVYAAGSGEKWTVKNPTIYKCEKVEVTNTITQSFSLNNDVYRYVLKSNQTSIHANEYDPLKHGLNYVNIGYGNLPVSFNTSTGLKENGLIIEYSRLGNLDAFYDSETDVDKILTNTSKDYKKWSCNYSVYDDIFDDPDDDLVPPIPGGQGLKLIYRPIDLKNPFPDINGQGRQTGSNWCDETGKCDNNNATVVKYITSKTDIYSKEPMYTFELTPVAIKEIRKYNNSKNEHNVKRTYSDFNLICETGTGNACVSDFLDQINDDTLNGRSIDFKAGGKCMVDSKRVSNSNEFYSCQN